MAEAQAPQPAAQGKGAETVEVNEFDSLLKKQFKPKTDHAMEAIKSAVQTLAEQALAGVALVSDDAVKSIEAMIAQIDAKLSEQLNLILHHPDFQKLEGTWRGLAHLINNTETDETLKIRVLNIPKTELGKTIKNFKGTKWDQSPLFKKIYEEEYGQAGGAPYGCLIGDYQFDHSPPDVEILQGMAQTSSPTLTFSGSSNSPRSKTPSLLSPISTTKSSPEVLEIFPLRIAPGVKSCTSSEATSLDRSVAASPSAVATAEFTSSSTSPKELIRL